MPYTRIAKLLPLLASDKMGEVAATAAAIGRLLAAHGLTWHDLAHCVGGSGGEGPEAHRRPPGACTAHSYAEAITIIFEEYRVRLKPGFETDFIESNVGRAFFSDKQRAIIDRLCRRFRIRVESDDEAPF